MRRVSRQYFTGVRRLTVFLDIRFNSELLQIRNIVEGPKNGLAQLGGDLNLSGRAQVNSDFVLGPLWVLDEMGEDAAANVVWGNISRMSSEHLARASETWKTVRRSTCQ